MIGWRRRWKEKRRKEKNIYSMVTETERNRNSSVKAGRLVGPVENWDYSFQQLSSNTDTRVLIGSWHSQRSGRIAAQATELCESGNKTFIGGFFFRNWRIYSFSRFHAGFVGSSYSSKIVLLVQSTDAGAFLSNTENK